MSKNHNHQSNAKNDRAQPNVTHGNEQVQGVSVEVGLTDPAVTVTTATTCSCKDCLHYGICKYEDKMAEACVRCDEHVGGEYPFIQNIHITCNRMKRKESPDIQSKSPVTEDVTISPLPYITPVSTQTNQPPLQQLADITMPNDRGEVQTIKTVVESGGSATLQRGTTSVIPDNVPVERINMDNLPPRFRKQIQVQDSTTKESIPGQTTNILTEEEIQSSRLSENESETDSVPDGNNQLNTGDTTT